MPHREASPDAPRTFSCLPIPRKQGLGLIGALILVVLFAGCRHSGGPAEVGVAKRRYRVEGASMVPTLVGRFREATCKRCELLWLIEPIPASGETREPSCRLCGDRLEVLTEDQLVAEMHQGSLNASLAHSSAQVDVITIETMKQLRESGGHLKTGDLVAARWGGMIHVKRIVAAAGDTVATRKSRLIVNDARIEDSLQSQPLVFPSPWMIVDSDACRDRSRWQIPAHEAGDDAAWERSSDGHWKVDSKGGREWLAYHHRSVDRGNIEAPVRDDYPFNTSATRKLFDVDRLRLSARLEADSKRVVEVAFWSESGPVVARADVAPGQRLEVSFYDGEPSDIPIVGATHPCAVRVVQGDATLTDLVIERHVEYRLRPHDETAAYPVTLGPGEFFLLGDNVPLSLDSRDAGVIATSQIIGRVIQREPTTRKMLRRLP